MFTRRLTAARATAFIAAAAVAQTPPAGAAAADALPTDQAQYIVVFKSGVEQPAAAAADLARRHSGRVVATFQHALKGFAARLPAAAVDALRQHPEVAYIEQDTGVRLSQAEIEAPQSQAAPSWGLDRIDQRTATLDGTYRFNYAGGDVHVFVLDTGIRADHVEFGGRVLPGADFIQDGLGTDDCRGHGTFVAGLIGGNTWGVAKRAKLVPVRMIDCTGAGSFTGVISALDWVAASGLRPAVANLSFSGGRMTSVNDAVAGATARGVVVVAAAGNGSVDACNLSPASAAQALTVGATQAGDGRLNTSNYGSCLDVFAPGSQIVSAWPSTSSASQTLSGTSMAAAHVSGVAALALAAEPTASVSAVNNFVIGNATVGVVGSAGKGSPNRLVYALGSGRPAEPPAIALTGLIGRGLVGSGSKWRASGTVSVAQWSSDGSSSSPRSGVTVNASFWPGGSASCVTGSNGQCTVTGPTLSTAYASSTLEVIQLSASGAVYDPTRNMAAPKITVLRP